MLGVGGTEVWICDRPLRRPLVRVDWSACSWSRELSEVSEASVSVLESRCGTLFSDALDGRVRSWRHGLYFVRQGKPQWSGPIVDITRDPDSEVITLSARDRLQWADRRYVHRYMAWKSVDLADAFTALLVEAMVRDAAVDLTPIADQAGVAGEREYLPNTDSNILSLISELVRTGFDYTVMLDKIYASPSLHRFVPKIVATQAAFLGRVGAREDGLAQENSSRVAGSNTGGSEGYTALGEYEDWDRADGLLERTHTESEILDSPSAYAAARDHVTRRAATPVSVRLPALAASFPAPAELILPGGRLELAIADPFFDLDHPYRIISLKANMAIGGDGGQAETFTLDAEKV